ncbi:MAG: phytanoyl-CoA dioxygenase family protein [Pseudomonadales bacterium]
MASTPFSQSNLEARDIASDCTAMENRIELLRDTNHAAPSRLLFPTKDRTELASHCRIPEIQPHELNTEVLRSAIALDGALIVRKLFSESMANTMVTAIDKVLDATESPGGTKNNAAERNTYYNPPDILKSVMPGKELGNSRGFHRNSGSAMCVESPTIAESLLQLYEQQGLKNMIAEYLGEPPCVSVKKWVLRRSKLPVNEAGWHQDGSFMGTDINSINMWIPLSRCGGDTGAPGMDVIPKRLHKIMSAEGSHFDWSVSTTHVANFFKDAPAVSPVFEPGDAFFFDHLYLHRTQYRQDYTRLRYAIETWFFGSSSCPRNQVPLAW